MAPMTRVWDAPHFLRYPEGRLAAGLPDSLAIDMYRKLAVSFLDWACCYGKDPPQHGEPYDLVIERAKRGWFQGYSSCGDLAHAMFESLGVCLPWVNRDGNGGWRVGRNVSLLYPGSNSCARAEVEPHLLRGGDVIVVANHRPPHENDDHVVCIVGAMADDGTLPTAEYGAAYPVAGGMRNRVLRRKNGIWYLATPGRNNDKRVQSVVRLNNVLVTAWDCGCLASTAVEYLRP